MNGEKTEEMLSNELNEMLLIDRNSLKKAGQI